MSILALTALNCISDRNKNTDNASRTAEIFESNEQTVINALSFYSQNLLRQHKTTYTECKSSFGLAQYINKFWIGHKNFGPAQNILGPV